MKKIDFNSDWYYKRTEEGGKGQLVSLPHDAMITEPRSNKSAGRHNIGWFEGHDYVYEKTYFASAGSEKTRRVLEFEGVYHNASVYVNDVKVAERPYGYTVFYADITDYLHYGQDNIIKVIAINSDQPNSRWYTGSGIYRPVWLYEGRDKYININGIKIHTAAISEGLAKIIVEAACHGTDTVHVDIKDAKENIVFTGEILAGRDNLIEIENPKLWSTDNPYLYTCTARVGDDVVSEHFGIRTLTWDSANGMAVSGEHVILKGACIHHDNGPLGACAFPEAEERKIRLLKETGYNAVRCAHNPCSKALLDACDRLGMFVMDEYVDMWYIHKNKFDYALYMRDWWKEDLKDMVQKDYNHPSVILYSTGNEVAETGQREGIELTRQMTDYLHSLDASRPVTCGINIFFNFLYSCGLGVYSDDKAKKEASREISDKPKKQKTVGSEFYNTLAGLLGDKTMKLGATLHMCDLKTRDAYAAMDVAGYNYGIFRYKHDLKKYPDRLILGSETFCKDAYHFMELAKKENRIVGDFVWAGMDYIGEAGIGAWEYEDYAPKGADTAGWLTAGSGRLNILGHASGEALYTRVALEKEQGPYLAVKPVYQTGKHSPSAWKMTDAMSSWTYPGCQGTMATVEVYARAYAVEVFLNGKSFGVKKLKNTCNISFKVPYEPGSLQVKAYDKSYNVIGQDILTTAGHDTVLTMKPEQDILKPYELGYINLTYTDARGEWKPMEKHKLTVRVSNGSLMGLGNACAYNTDGYQQNSTFTYYGQALAIVRAKEKGPVLVTVTDETDSYQLTIPLED